MPAGVVETIPAEDFDDVLRVVHANSITADGKSTNLETLRDIEALHHVRDAITERMKGAKSDADRKEVDALIKRFLGPDCAFDRQHADLLFQIAIVPQSVGWYWKLRERLHRFIHPH